MKLDVAKNMRSDQVLRWFREAMMSMMYNLGLSRYSVRDLIVALQTRRHPKRTPTSRPDTRCFDANILLSSRVWRWNLDQLNSSAA